MRSFREISEARGDTAVFTFGRFNPPTTGHEKLIDALAREQGKNAGSKMYVYPSKSQNAKKDPLPYAKKVAYMKKMFPKYSKNITVSTPRTAIEVAVELYKKGHKAIVMVVGSDRVAEFDRLLNEYNGVEGKKHGYYGFDNIEVVSAGERDPDSEGVEGMSASKMRKAAIEDDSDTFSKGVSKELSKKDKEALYLTLRQSMNVKESFDDFAEASYDLYEIAPKLDPQGLREAYFENDLFAVGTFVENVNTGIISKVVSRGSNYVISIDESDNIFRSWLKDLIEKNDRFGFDWTPAGEHGTDELDNYMRRLTPGEFIRKINRKEKVTAKK